MPISMCGRNQFDARFPFSNLLVKSQNLLLSVQKRCQHIFIQSRQVVMNYMVMINIKYLKYLRKYSVSVHGNIVILVKF